jgi:hypothetical protein
VHLWADMTDSSVKGIPRAVPLIILEPAPGELGLNQESYDAAIQQLEELGHIVTLRPPDEDEGFPEPEAAVDTLAVYLFDEFVDEHVIDAIVAVLIDRLIAGRLHSQRARQAVIYGPDASVVRTFELPMRDD